MGLFTNIKVIAFDLDGTLVNSAQGLSYAVDNTLKQFGLPEAGAEVVTTWIGNGVETLLQRALSWAGVQTITEQQKQQAMAWFNHYYAVSAIEGSTLYPAVQSTLKQLHKCEIPMAIVTNKANAFVHPILSNLGISDYISFIVGGDDVPIKKPDPAMVFRVLKQFFLSPDELLLIGDSKNDIVAARRAGVVSIGVDYGYNYGRPIAEEKPDKVLSSLEQLLPLLGR